MLSQTQVVTRASDLELRHEPNAPGRNVLNNRAFAVYQKNEAASGIMVEVVRRCKNTSRVRSALHSNGRTYAIPTFKLSNYYHVDEKGRVVREEAEATS